MNGLYTSNKLEWSKGIEKYDVQCFKLKEGSIGSPKTYLSSYACKMKIKVQIEAQTFSLAQYFRLDAKNTENNLCKRGAKLMLINETPL